MEQPPWPPEPPERERWDEPPEPPAFGTVLPAPPVSVEPLRKGRLRPFTWGIALAAAVIGLGVGLWLSGDALRGDDSSDAPAEPALAAAPPPAAAPVALPPPELPSIPAPPQLCPEGMTFVQGGKFFMGSDAKHPVLRTASPAHQVEVSDFCLDQTEVTLGAYRECSTQGECKRAFRDSDWPRGDLSKKEWDLQRTAFSTLCNENYDDRDDHPVNCVTWHQARAYCEKRGATLPTEAQWEYAARGSDGRVYSWGDAIPDSERMNGCGQECIAWREQAGLSSHAPLYAQDDGYPGTAPVRSYPAGRSQHGLYDMAGNLFEWTLDAHRPYGEADLPKAPDEEPQDRVIRGGAFNSFMPEFADPALRFPQAQDAHTHGIGFRCARSPLR